MPSDAGNLDSRKINKEKNEDGWQENYGNKVEIIKYFYRYSDDSIQTIASICQCQLAKSRRL